jgi:hypothetical protein
MDFRILGSCIVGQFYIFSVWLPLSQQKNLWILEFKVCSLLLHPAHTACPVYIGSEELPMTEAAARQIHRDKSVSSFIDLNVVTSCMIE